MERISLICMSVLLLFGPLASAEEESIEKGNKLYYRIAAGLGTEERLVRIVRGRISVQEDRTGILGFEIGKPIVEDFLDWPLDFVAKAGIIRHFERSFQDDFFQFTLSVKAYYKGFPWSHKIRTRFGIAEGLSYAEKIPFTR